MTFKKSISDLCCDELNHIFTYLCDYDKLSALTIDRKIMEKFNYSKIRLSN
ncbi:hypothetical protein Catovirus_1_586 [Catovirus CTV1]|uniref:Uncharacterized protein n=1 Tax=Catovirus CTV1 TaxID=1977631 RepID=A0A1V0S9Z7_9VIRU|nr:hypothetical protein Catovirus_1_586 [Catovirus CTV1]